MVFFNAIFIVFFFDYLINSVTLFLICLYDSHNTSLLYLTAFLFKCSLLYINLTMLLSIHGLFRFLSRRVSNGAHVLLTVRNTLLNLSHFSESICSGQSVLVMESFSNSSFLNSSGENFL